MRYLLCSVGLLIGSAVYCVDEATQKIFDDIYNAIDQLESTRTISKKALVTLSESDSKNFNDSIKNARGFLKKNPKNIESLSTLSRERDGVVQTLLRRAVSYEKKLAEDLQVSGICAFSLLEAVSPIVLPQRDDFREALGFLNQETWLSCEQQKKRELPLYIFGLFGFLHWSRLRVLQATASISGLDTIFFEYIKNIFNVLYKNILFDQFNEGYYINAIKKCRDLAQIAFERDDKTAIDQLLDIGFPGRYLPVEWIVGQNCLKLLNDRNSGKSILNAEFDTFKVSFSGDIEEPVGNSMINMIIDKYFSFFIKLDDQQNRKRQKEFIQGLLKKDTPPSLGIFYEDSKKWKNLLGDALECNDLEMFKILADYRSELLQYGAGGTYEKDKIFWDANKTLYSVAKTDEAVRLLKKYGASGDIADAGPVGISVVLEDLAQLLSGLNAAL